MTGVITVAVASYNHLPYVEECLDSIAAQSWPEIELCWVDDHSSDGTFEHVERLLGAPRYETRFTRTVLRRNYRNRGAHYSLNLAARLGQGAIISFMNSDDSYHPDRLARFMAAYDGEADWFAFSNVLPVDPDGAPLAVDPTGERIAFDADAFIARFGSVSAALLARQIASTTGNFVVTRRLFTRLGGFQDLKYCHDWMFALQACLHCEPVFLRGRLYNYRLHPTNSFRSLASVAEAESARVLQAYVRAVALQRPANPVAPCPRARPAGFWDLMELAGATQAAERVFFPYMRNSRHLDVQDAAR